ncbi:MAG: hypothetical protein DRQ08_06795 [Candidatus Latescibacterota bacterium]|nr:MAG: hypothetical protein DRQ08_06795 [Candidatus Latescibacterota bacterium]
MASKEGKGVRSNKSRRLELEPLSEVVNIKAEEDERVVKIAEDKNVALIAFIAPYVAVRISPVEEARAFIGLPDEFGIEALIELLSKENIRSAYLLVNSPGGAMASSYKIAKAIRSALDNIITFVPHIAASGGTLLALTGNEIVMGLMSHLTPLDVQISYKDTTVSAATFMRFFSRASKWFERIKPEEAPYPHRALADKLDPFLMEEWSGVMDTAMSYVSEILNLAGYKDSEEIAQKLVLTFPSHGYVITRDKAKEIGLNIKDSEDFKGTWSIMRYWLGKYIFEEEITHCIRYVLPIMHKEKS